MDAVQRPHRAHFGMTFYRDSVTGVSEECKEKRSENKARTQHNNKLTPTDSNSFT